MRGRRKEQSSSLVPNAKAQIDGKIPSKGTTNRGESPEESVRIRHVICGTLTECYNYKSECGCTYGDKSRFRDVEADGQPSKKSKKSGGKGSVALLKESIQLVCVSQDSHPRESILREEGQLGSNQKCEPHERSPCAP